MGVSAVGLVGVNGRLTTRSMHCTACPLVHSEWSM